ncbi:MAG: porin family protein [Candidatus Electrothrix sp. Rat3]|nr:porin family protein [Candidatus Electrothrix rattekaaiensis]
MKKMTAIVIFLLTLGCVEFAFADDFFSVGEKYFGADIVKYDDYGINAQGVFGAYIGKLGPLPLALEGRASFSIADEDNVQLDYHIGGYLRAEYRAGQFRPYGLFGFSHAEASMEIFGVEITDDDTDFSLGAGLQYDFLNGFSLNAEFLLQLVDDVDGFSIGLRKRF